MKIRSTICDFCHKRIDNNAQDYDFPYLGDQVHDGPTHQIINLCPECIERIKNLKKELTPKNP